MGQTIEKGSSAYVYQYDGCNDTDYIDDGVD